MDLEDTGSRARYMIRDRNAKFAELLHAILATAGIDVVLSGIQIPSMNPIMEQWVQNCRRELLDRTLIWNQIGRLDIRRRDRLGGLLHEYQHAA